MSTRRLPREPSPPPLPHQEEGIDFLRGRAAAGLFDEQGLGKSKQLIEAVARDVSDGVLDGALIIAPNSLKATWAEEIERHSTLRYALFGAGKRARRDAFRSLKAHFYVINYEAVASELPALRALLRFKRMALVLDESHRIKSPGARVTRAVHALRGEAVKRVLMSGTPVANTPEDLWSQFFFLDDGAAVGASFEGFRERFGTASRGFVRVGELRDALATIGLRRTKDGALTLPAKRISRVGVRLGGRQLEMYESLRQDLVLWVTSLNGDEVATHAEAILARLVRLAQVASNPTLLDAGYGETPAKFAALDTLVAARLASPGKLIIWTSFVGNVIELGNRYANFGAVVLHGEVEQHVRDASVRRFKTDPDVRVLVANPMVAREGLTLTVANFAIYVDRTFNLVDYLQSQDRIHRLSQTEDCEVVLLIAENSIDEFVDFALEQKLRLARFAQADESHLSADDAALQKPAILRALLSPGPHADHLAPICPEGELPSQVEDRFWLFAAAPETEEQQNPAGPGKWLVFVSRTQVDALWEVIGSETRAGRLGPAAKVSTARPNPNAKSTAHVICVYTRDAEDETDKTRVREALRALGITQKVPYKSDAQTHEGQYAHCVPGRVSNRYE